MPPILVYQFSPGALNAALSNESTSPSEVGDHLLVTYLHGYLKEVGVKSLLIEETYTDADFLDDYASYYARCFSPYQRRCKRVHFFRRELTEIDFRQLLVRPLSDQDKESLQADYLGFVVARPLPQAIIGRSILRPYDNKADRRFPVARKYKVNLFGIDLEVLGLAFQEQDTVLAACATVALWSAFHKTAELFGTPIPTPAIITRAATQAEHFGRPIPQHGLRVEEVCNAIRHNGLEPEVVDLNRSKDVPLISLLYGYLQMGLPAILIVAIPDVGWHAITLTGFSIQKTEQRPQEVPGNATIVPMVGRKIDKLYGQDDQIGPYSRLLVRDSPTNSITKCVVRLESSWKDPKGNSFLYPMAVVVPVYNKIRLTFLDVQRWLAPIHPVFAGVLPSVQRIEWDVQLIFSNELKRQIKDDADLSESIRANLLLTHQPRFWWRARMRYGGLAFCDFLFDATGIARSFPLSTIVWRVQGFASSVENLIQTPGTLASLQKMLRSERYIEFLKGSIGLRDRPGDLLRG